MLRQAQHEDLVLSLSKDESAQTTGGMIYFVSLLDIVDDGASLDGRADDGCVQASACVNIGASKRAENRDFQM